MTRRAAAVPAVLALLLTGCGGDNRDVADDPAATIETPSPSPSPSPSDPPTGGPYPDFEPTSYSFVLVTSCFCLDAGTPVAITVVDDEITEAVLAADGTGRGGGEEGDPAAGYLRLTIDDIIRKANTAQANGAAVVTLTWSTGDGPRYPVSVYIDEDENMADEQVGYSLSDVVVT